MSNSSCFTNARIVTRRELIDGTLSIVDGCIDSLSGGASSVAGVIDLEGDYLIPGLVELHTDNFERHLMPRPRVRWPELPALLAHDAEVAAAGITTVFDALGVGDADGSALRGQSMRGILDCLAHATRERLLRADHRLHVRCELPAPNAIELFEPFARHPLVGLLSLMDHTPGQRQWTNLDQARAHWTAKKGWSEDKIKRHFLEAPERQQQFAPANRRYFIDYARAQRIPLASHDDTTAAHVLEARRDGVAISEFPTSLEAARSARELGLSIVMGAPNVVRGGSHSGNVAAIELAKRGLLDTLSSDYVPASLLHAAYLLHRDGGFDLPEAIATVSSNPARSVGLADRGEIAMGKRADLVQVRIVAGHPMVRAVWRAGVRVS